jgi:hypothetical protein
LQRLLGVTLRDSLGKNSQAHEFHDVLAAWLEFVQTAHLLQNL